MRRPERVRTRGPDTQSDTLSNMSASMSADTQSDTDDGTRRACPAPPLWPRRGQGAEDTFGCVVAPKPTHPDMSADTLADMSGGHATGHVGGHARTRSDTLHPPVEQYLGRQDPGEARSYLGRCGEKFTVDA